MSIRFFSSPAAMRKWFEKNHAGKMELLVGFHKVKTGKATISWSQAVDEALCFGWIDGKRKSIDDDKYVIRFTPRKSTSIWSVKNIQKVKELTNLGLMKPEGNTAFEKRAKAKSGVYSFEQRKVAFSKELKKIFTSNKKAWNYFRSEAPWYQRTVTWFVMSAKQETTRLSRLNQLIKDSEAGERIKEVRWSKKSKKATT
jgi:uncharacterized protein YdeI (YjbR/CyaY-like superfamily)